MVLNSERPAVNGPSRVSLVREISLYYRWSLCVCQSLISEFYLLLLCVRDRVGVLSLLLWRGLVRSWVFGVASGARSRLPAWRNPVQLRRVL